MPHTVCIFIQLDTDAIQADHTLGEWAGIFHDVVEAEPHVSWHEVYEAIASDYLSGGEYDRYVLGESGSVERDE